MPRPAPTRSLGEWPVVAGMVLLVLGFFGIFAWKALRWPDEITELANANPGWTLARSGAGHLRLTEKATAYRALINEEEAGPYTIGRLPCHELGPRYPPWFRVPPEASEPGQLACVRISGPDSELVIVSFLATLGVPEVWTDYYEPLINDQGYDYWGGGSSAAGADRLNNVIGYGVSPRSTDPADDDARKSRLTAFYVEGKTQVVVSFRQPVAAPHARR